MFNPARPISGPALAATLLGLSAIPILAAVPLLVQIPLGDLPPQSARYNAVSISLFVHAAGGILFGLLGPIQFARAQGRRYGRWHRIMGRVFWAAGMLLALSSLRLLWQFPDAATWILRLARLAASLGLIAALILGLRAAIMRDMPRHRAWMIRAYAIGMGAATIALVMFPIYLITGAPLSGYASDIAFVGSWVLNIAAAEWVIRRLR
jgi:hypothetical protein